MGGKGRPVDSLDLLCQKNARCMHCIKADFPTCDLHGEKYRYNIDDNGEISCERNLKGSCKEAQCLCDKELAIEIGKIWLDTQYDISKWWNSKNKNAIKMDHYSVCQPVVNGFNTGNGQSFQDSCCGESYPHRYPHLNKNYNCCSKSGKIYDAAMYQCCLDGTVKIVC